MFKVEIKTGGAAYRDEDGGKLDPGNYELISNLNTIIHSLSAGFTSGSVFDICGNKVGTWSLED